MLRKPASSVDEPRCDRSAPAQKAGGAPVTTTACTRSSASARSNAATMPSTVACDSTLRLSGSSSVTTATPSRTSTGTASLIADDGRGVAEEVLDVALVVVRGLIPDRAAETAGLGEAVDRAGGRVLVLEPRPLELAAVDT